MRADGRGQREPRDNRDQKSYAPPQPLNEVMIAGYNGVPVPLAHPELILTSRLRLQGFIVSEQASIWPRALGELATGVASGSLKYRETVASGLPSAPSAFLGLLQGRNFGKQLVKLD